jgi:hypothetical protein
MTKLTPQQLREIYQKLPEDLKDAIFSVDSAEIIQFLGKKYNLAVDKIGELADETGLVMLGVTHPRDFISNLAQRINFDKETARKIAEEINTQIFAKVRTSLKKIHGITEEGTPFIKTLGKKAIIEEIEREEVPEILKGTTQPPAPSEGEGPPHPFEAKTKEEIFRIPPEEKKYPSGDPYREPIE